MNTFAGRQRRDRKVMQQMIDRKFWGESTVSRNSLKTGMLFCFSEFSAYDVNER